MIYGRDVASEWGGAFYPDDGDGRRNLLSVAEGRLEAVHRRWEESLRRLILAGGSSAALGPDREPDALVRQVRDTM